MNKKLRLIGTILLVVLVIASCSKKANESNVVKLYPVRSGASFSYIDSTGKTIISPQFKEATVFRDGLALVQVFGAKPMWGFIKEDGSFSIKATLKEATVFREDMAWVVSENGAPKAINLAGDSLFTLKQAKTVRVFHEGLAAFSISVDTIHVIWGFVDKKGIVKIQPQFQNVRDFSDGHCAVCNSAGEWGYVDTEGKVAIGNQFTNANDFIHGRAIVQSGKEWGVIDVNGKFSINPRFTEMKADRDQYIIKQNSKWGWCSHSGSIDIEPGFNDAAPFNGNELAPVKVGDKYGFISKKGKLVIEAQFDSVMPFNGGIAWVMSHGKGGFIDKNAKYIIQSQYEEISKDVKAYLLSGSSAYESVNTDYFDRDTIISRLKRDITEKTVAGMDFSTPMSVIYRKYKKTELDFIKNASEHKIISAERISNDATLDFFILGTPWTETYKGNLGFSYSMKPNYRHTGFTYRINLTAKGLGKEDVILKMLETALNGYTRDEKHSNANVLILQSKFQLIVGLKQLGMIILAVYPLTPENLQMVDENYGDGMANDSITVASDSLRSK